jgi:predicted porin
LGFRGTEDLGGGTASFFTFETGLSPNATSNSSSLLSAFNIRQAFVGLSQKGLGRMSMGTMQTTIHDVVGSTTAGANNNLVGDLLYTVNGTAGGISQSTTGTYGMTSGQSYTVRANNMVKFATENMAGFQGNAMVIYQGTDTNQTGATAGGQSQNTGYGLGVNYTWQKLFLTANYQSFTNQITANNPGTSTVAPTMAIFGAAQSATTGTNVNDNQMYIAGTYDFGILKAFAGYVNRKASAVSNSLYFQRYTAQQVGVTAPVTKTVNMFASVSTGSWENTGFDVASAKINGYQLGSNYILSKRTNLYAIFGNASQSVAANSTVLPSTAANTSYNINNYAVGMRHTF